MNEPSPSDFVDSIGRHPSPSPPLTERIAVCSWSLLASNPTDLVQKLQIADIHRVQLAINPLRDNPSTWAKAKNILRKSNIEIISGMFECIGEDYSTLETIRLSGGITPDSTWENNLENIHAIASIASNLKLELITFHAGFVPHDSSDPNFLKMMERLTIIANVFANVNITVGLETGQETAHDLAKLLVKLNHPNLFVNFDPANMILYGQGDPIEAVRLLAPWIRQIHVKDAIQSKVRAIWGQEVPMGTGQINWESFFTTLVEINFQGDFVIEREAGESRIDDICVARETILNLYPNTLFSE
jgi:L-ribulose-5-phosphate 3-epimerase